MKHCFKNILETSTVTLAAGAEDPAFPLYRLYDRDIGKPFKAQTASTLSIKIDQGPNLIGAADRLLIPAGHNLDGMLMDIQYSDDDISYTNITPQFTQMGDGLIEKSWTARASRFWKFTITNPAVVPQMPELFLTETHEWQKLPARPGGPFEDVFNVIAGETVSGLDRSLICGGPKRQRVYNMKDAGEAQKADILGLNSAWQGAKPFWLYDHEGNWIYGRLRSPLALIEDAYSSYSYKFDFVEVLG